PGQVVQHDHPVGDPERVVVGQRHHAGTELDVPGLRGRPGDEHGRVRDYLGAARVVLTDPRLVVAELVEQLDGGEISGVRQRRVLLNRGVVWAEEYTESHAVDHRMLTLNRRLGTRCTASAEFERYEPSAPRSSRSLHVLV